MADRNPYIPSERVLEHEQRTEVDEREAKDRFAQKQRKLQEKAAGSPPTENRDGGATPAEE